MELMSKLDAIDKALAAWDASPNGRSGMEAAIRTFCHARGLVMVPGEPTQDMIDAAWDAPVGEIYTEMLAAAPDPFGDAP